MRPAPLRQCRSPIRSRGPGPMLASPPRSTAPGSGARRPRKASATPISLAAHARAEAAGNTDLTDDAAVAEFAGTGGRAGAGERIEPQAHDCGGPGHGRQGVHRSRSGHGCPHRAGFRRSPLHRGQPCLAVRREDPSHARPGGSFRRRCRPACAHRRPARRHRRRRYRPAFSRYRPALEGRPLAPVPDRGRASRACGAADASAMST